MKKNYFVIAVLVILLSTSFYSQCSLYPVSLSSKVNNSSLIIETLGGNLEVSFQKEGNQYSNVFLKGLATFVFNGDIEI